MTIVKENKEWIELYGPETLEECVGNEDVTAAIMKNIENGTFKPIILHGPAGTGKTLRARLIAKAIHGENWRAHTLDLNASDDNGVEVVRTTIKQRASQGAFFAKQVIILDEADGMTPQAQAAGRRVIQDYSKNTLFIICANDITKIIDPLKSRCKDTMYEIGYASDDEISDLCISTLIRAGVVGEGVVTHGDIPSVNISEVVDVAEGEPRAAIKYLQAIVEGTYIKPKTASRKFANVMRELENKGPMEAIKEMTADNLDAFSMYIMRSEKRLPLDVRMSIVQIITDADNGIQHSHNPDVHVLNMLIRIYQVI